MRVLRGRMRAVRTVAERQEEDDFFIGRKAEKFFGFRIGETVDPDAIDADVAGFEHHVRRDDADVFDAGMDAGIEFVFPFFVGIVGEEEDNRRAVAARGERVHFRERFRRFQNINALRLEIFCRRGEISRFQNFLEFFVFERAVGELTHGETGLAKFHEVHNGPPFEKSFWVLMC